MIRRGPLLCGGSLMSQMESRNPAEVLLQECAMRFWKPVHTISYALQKGSGRIYALDLLAVTSYTNQSELIT